MWRHHQPPTADSSRTSATDRDFTAFPRLHLIRQGCGYIYSTRASSFNHVIDKGKEFSDDVNKKIGVVRDVGKTLKDGYNNVIKPAVPSLKINPLK